MTVDLLEWRHSIVETVSGLDKGDIGVGLLCFGTLMGMAYLYRRWRKRRGYRMVVRERMTKNKRLLADIINDGLFEAECAGKISNQEVLKLYADLAKKLDIPDLIPKKKMAQLVKAELKANRNSTKNAKARSHKPNIPGPKPTEIAPKVAFTERVGKFAMNWRKRAA